MQRVVDSQMCSCSCQLVVGAPFVTENLLPGRTCWEIRGSKVAASRFSTSTKKRSPLPLSIPPNTQCPPTTLPTVVFLLPKFAFIDFNFYPWPANHSRMNQKVLLTNITYKVVPVHSGGTAYLQYAKFDFTLQCCSISSCTFPTRCLH